MENRTIHSLGGRHCVTSDLAEGHLQPQLASTELVFVQPVPPSTVLAEYSFRRITLIKTGQPNGLPLEYTVSEV